MFFYRLYCFLFGHTPFLFNHGLRWSIGHSAETFDMMAIEHQTSGAKFGIRYCTCCMEAYLNVKIIPL